MMNSFKVCRTILCMVIILAFFTFPSTIANFILAEDSKNENQVNITWDEFKKLIKIDSDEVKLSWDEFRKLVAQTGSEVKIEYNIQNGMVILNRDQFKRLLAQMKPPDMTPVVPPKDHLITKAEYSGIIGEKSTTFNATFTLEIFKKERNTYPKIRILPQTVALKDITINDKPALVINEDGWYVLTTDEVGHHTVNLAFSIQSNLNKGVNALNFQIPQTAITLLKLDIPLQDVKVEIPQSKHVGITRKSGHAYVDAVLATTHFIQVNVHRKVALDSSKKRGPAKVYAETMNLLSIEDDALRITTKFKLNILQNTVQSLDLIIPQGYSILYVTDQNNQEMRDWTTKKVKDKEQLTIPFAGERKGIVVFHVTAEKIFSEKENELGFNGYQIKKAIREIGYIGGDKKSTAEAEITKQENLDRVDIQELPYDLISMSAKPPIFGLRYLRHPFLLTLKITKHEELATVNTVIDNASVMSVLLEEGKIITRTVYTLRNTWKQFLQLTLPKDSEIWSLYVNGKRELPSKNQEGKFMIPLIRSKVSGDTISSFNVEILSYEKTGKMDIVGRRHLSFPHTDIVTSKILWSVYLPVNYQILHFGGNVEKEKIATGIRLLLGGKRVFNYEDINGYNEVVSSFYNKGGKVSNKRIDRMKRNLQSDFRQQVGSDKSSLAKQISNEINFAQNIREEQNRGVMEKGSAGVALLKIEIPTSGQLYRFAKTIVEGEDLYINFEYTSNWISTLTKIFLLGLLLFILYKLRAQFKRLYITVKSWIESKKAFWDSCASPGGTRIILVILAIVFLFISRFLFIIVMLLLLVAWFKPEWLFRQLLKNKKQ